MIAAPELDDLHDTDDLVPLRLVIPSEFQSDSEPSAHAYRDSHVDLSDGTALTDVIDMRAHRSGGAHRKQTVGAVKSRLMIAAMAAGNREIIVADGLERAMGEERRMSDSLLDLLGGFMAKGYAQRMNEGAK